MDVPPPPPTAACYAAAWGAFCAGADCCGGNFFACNGARTDASNAYNNCCFEAGWACEAAPDYDECMMGVGCSLVGGGFITVPPGADPCGQIDDQPAELSWGAACQEVAEESIEDFIWFISGRVAAPALSR